MLGTIFGLMLLLLVLTVPIGVVLLCVSLSPVLIDHNDDVTVPCNAAKLMRLRPIIPWGCRQSK